MAATCLQPYVLYVCTYINFMSTGFSSLTSRTRFILGANGSTEWCCGDTANDEDDQKVPPPSRTTGNKGTTTTKVLLHLLQILLLLLLLDDGGAGP